MPKTIGIIFATSKRRMTLLTKIMHATLEASAIDEWHVWNFMQDFGDREWVHGLASHNIIVRDAGTPKEAYGWYTPNKCAPNDVFVKCDDGIAYVDIEGLKHMVNYHRLNPQHYLVSANVVNHPTCYLLQRDLGMWADLPLLDSLMESVKQCHALHAAFLGGEKVLFESVAEINEDVKMPITLVSWLGRDVESVRSCTQGQGDEFNLSHSFPKIFKRPVAVFGPCVASVLSFRTQEEPGVSFDDLIRSYTVFRPQHTMEPLVLS